MGFAYYTIVIIANAEIAEVLISAIYPFASLVSLKSVYSTLFQYQFMLKLMPFFYSASGQPAIDSTAEYYDQSYPALSQTNARLEFSPDENTLMIADTELDLIFYLYTKPNGEATVNASIGKSIFKGFHCCIKEICQFMYIMFVPYLD